MSDRLLQIMSGDISTSEQYRDTFRRSELLEPEKALLIALLEDGIHEYRKYYQARDRDGQRRFRKACEWLMADDEAWIFSFVNVCELLNLDPKYVRRRMREAKDPASHNKSGNGSRKRLGGSHKHRSALRN